MYKLLILLYSWVAEGRFSGVKTRFLPHSRDMRTGSASARRHLGLLRRDPAVDDEAGAGHEAGVVRGEKDDALGDVGHRPHAADRDPGQRLLARRFEVIWCRGCEPAS